MSVEKRSNDIVKNTPEKSAAEIEFHEDYQRLEKVIAQYLQNPDIRFTFRKEKGFYINYETLEVNLDPTFTAKLELGRSGALFGAFHEAEHFRDMLQNVEAYKHHFLRLKQLSEQANDDKERAYAKALKRFYNILDDVMVNRNVQGRWPACDGRFLASLYTKLFPQKNLLAQSKHVQFESALIRELMTGETCDVDADIRTLLDEAIKTVRVVSSFSLANRKAEYDPMVRYTILRNKIEPIFASLFKQNSENDSQNDASTDEGSEGGEEVDQIDHDQLFDAITKIKEKIVEKKNKEVQELYGVEKSDKDAYDAFYEANTDSIDQLVHFFKSFIRNQTYSIKEKRLGKKGQLAPSRHVEAYTRAEQNELDEARVYEEKYKVLKEKPLFTDFELTLVADGSGSMETDARKKRSQQQAIMMLVEAIIRFQEEVKDLQEDGVDIRMDLKTQVREFADNDQLLHDFNTELDFVTRVKLFKRLNSLSSGNNNESETLSIVHRDVRKKTDAIMSGNLKKLVIFITDGESDGAVIQSYLKQIYSSTEHSDNFRLLGIGIGPGTETTSQSYAPHGKGNLPLDQLPEHLTHELENFIVS